MECHCIRYRDVPHTTRLFSTFNEDFHKVADFYSHPPDEAGIRAAAGEIRLGPEVRHAVAAVLRKQNRMLGNDTAAERNVERLADGAAAIVAGQQVGLFGGPAYSIYKALDAIHWAERLTRAGVEAVPVFWMATEDHDLAEVNQAFWNSREGVARLELPIGEGLVGRSVGRISLGEHVAAAVDHATQLLEGPAAKEIREALGQAYRTEETFGSAFAKLMARLMAGRGLILLDPLDTRLHELARPIYRKAVEESEKILEELLTRNKALERGGFHAQVKITKQSTLLFVDVNGTRSAIRRRNGDFIAGELKLDAADLLGRIENQAEGFTASVLLRPIVQDWLLPTAAIIAGPAEVAYLAQAEVLYRRILGRMPAILPRASLTLVEPEVGRLLKKYELDFADTLRGRQQVRHKIAAKCLPRGISARFARDEKALQRMLERYRSPLARLDKTLLGALDTAERKMLYQFVKLRGKAGRAEGFRTGVLGRHEGQIVSALFPHHGLQERTLSLLPFIARQGVGLLDRLADEIAKPCSGHRLVAL